MSRFFSHARRMVAVLAAFTAAQIDAADTRPVVGPGASKDDIINAYGWPTGQSQSGTREIFTYPQGQVFLDNGKVERVDFSPNVPWPPPRPRPGAPITTTKKAQEPTLDFWTERMADAQAEAARRNARILALFVGSDWSPGSRQFMEEVAFHPDFVNTFTGDFVFLRLDYPTRVQQAPEIRDQNAQLREKYQVTTYPSLLVLSATGEQVAVVDLIKPRTGDTYRAHVIEAVNEVRGIMPKVVVPEPPPPPDKPQDIPNAGAASLTKSYTLIMGAIAAGLAMAGIAWWLLWKAKAPPKTVNIPKFQMADRISEAASGLPPASEMMRWPREKLRTLVASLAEANGYHVVQREGGGDGDLALHKRGADKPEIIICCQPGSGAAAASKRAKELFGIITVEDVPKGWLVAPSGFTDEAREFVKNRPIVLIDSEHLLAQLRDLPPISLDKIIARDL